MATVEAETSRDEQFPPGGSVYDGFISYSHAADDLLAPRLQAGLQRFAKPWWKRRALRIFRDESSLSANPHLWSSITEAVDRSAWFVLLLSPDAAESPWVNNEVEYWLEHKDPDRIIPVLTDGDFGWAESDVTGDAVPPALQGAFADEPRWVDLRFARTEEQLDLNNPEFSAAVADVASALHGVPKDELASEEVRQHRRTVRTAWAGAGALLVMVVIAAGAAIYASQQRNEADAQRVAAEESAANESTAREAEAEQRAAAEMATVEAQAEALAAHSLAQLESDPELSVLLASQALELSQVPAASNALHTALQAHRTIFQLDGAGGSLVDLGAMSPAGDLLAVVGGRSLEVWEVGGSEPLWTLETPAELDLSKIIAVRFSVDGDRLFVLPTWLYLSPDAPPRPAEAPHGLFVYDARTGEELETIAIPDCPPLMLWPGTFPPYIDVGKPMFLVTPAGCATRQEFDNSGDVWMRDPTDGSWSLLPVTVFDTTLGVPTLDEAGERFAIGQGGPSQVIELATNDVVYEWEGGLSTLSADGTRMLGGSFNTGFPLELWDIEDQQLLWRFDETFSRGWFSDDETLVYGGGFGGATYVLDAETGFEVIRLRGHTGRQIDVFMSADNQRVATISADGTARVWDIGSVGVSEGLLYTTHDRPRHHMWSSGDAAAGVAAIWSGSPLSLDTDWETVVLDLESGETLMTVAGGSPGLSPDGTMMAYRVVDKVSLSEEQIGDPTVEPGEYYRVGDVRIVDVRSGEVIAELDAPCDTYLVGFQLPELGCGLQAAAFDWDLDFSPDTRLVGLTDGVGDAMVVWEIATGEVIGSDQMETLSSVNLAFTPDGSRVVAEFGCGTEHWLRVYDLDPFTMVQEVQHAENCYRNMIFTPDGSLLVAGDFLGNVVLIDTDTWEVRSQFSAHQGQGVHHVSVSPSGNLIASAGDDGVRVWNIADESLRTEVAFNVDAIRNVMFIDDTHVLAVPRWENIGLVVTLDPSELARLANQRITRTFTEVECATYGIDPCPSLAEIKNR